MTCTKAFLSGTAVAIVALLAGLLLSRALTHRPAGPALAHGTLIDPAREIADFSLLDQDGGAFTRAGLAGHWSILFFGFTNCPDVCPTTLATLAQLEPLLADLPDERRPRVLFVSVDSQRDTPEKVKAYAGYFSPAFRGVTGTEKGIATFTRSLSVPYAVTPLADGGYTVDHAASLFVLDPQVRLRALFSPPHDIKAMAADLRQLVTQP